jgi:predicted HicB family RNase H-like nuclease
MITLKEWMEVVNYRITEGSNFMWDCYGPDSYSLDSWSGSQDGHSFTVIFDTKTQVVYEVQSHDYRTQRAYRLVNPDFKSERDIESADRNVSLDQAWDEVNYVDLEEDDDWFQKALAIEAGEDYDTRVTVPLDLDEHEMFTLMKMAHERDLTLNEFVEEILREQLTRMGVKL